jgi:oligosaccharide repeat unit polymerase
MVTGINLPKAPSILLGLTLFVLSIHLLSGGNFGEVDLFVYAISLYYLIFFSFSFYVILFLLGYGKNNKIDIFFITYVPRKYTFLIFILLLFLYLWTYISLIGFDYINLMDLRSNLISLYRSEDVSAEFKFLNTIGLCVFFFASYLFLISQKHNLFYSSCALSFPLLMANRNFILIFFIFALFKIIVIKRKTHLAALILALFFTANMLYVYVFDKGLEGLNIVVATILSILNYLAAPLHGLNFSLNYPSNYGDFLTFPASLVAWLGYSVNRDFLYTPYPNETNVYTLFYSVIYDFGVIGVGIIAILFGAFHAYLYFKSKSSGLFLFIYLYSLYPLLMTFFDNTYTTSLGVWVYLFFPFIFFKGVRQRSLN